VGVVLRKYRRRRTLARSGRYALDFAHP
jgi:hypothetical protein